MQWWSTLRVAILRVVMKGVLLLRDGGQTLNRIRFFLLQAKNMKLSWWEFYY